MKTIKQVAVLLLVLVGLSSRVALAQENKLIMAPSIKLPVLMAGEEEVVTDDIDGDLIGAGGQVRIVSAISGDAYIGAGQVDFEGSVDQDLVVGGGRVTISGRIGKNLIVVGGKVTIEDSAMVGGYVLAAGGEVLINGQIEGPVKTATRKLAIGELAYIGGNLEADVEQAVVAETAQLGGEKNINVHKVETPKTPESTKEAMRGVAVVGKIVFFLSKLVTLLVLVALAGKLMSPAGVLFSKFWTTLGWGMVVVIVTPFVMLILMMTVLGIPLSVITFGIYILAMYLSSLVVAMALGNIISKNGWLPIKNNYVLSVVGLIIISILTGIPWVGWLFSMVVCFLGLGIMFKLVTKRNVIPVKKK